MKVSDHPICPKCGYDQSGIIAAWSQYCPIRGVCPECGFDLEWGSVLNPERIRLGWYVEHADRPRAMAQRTPATAWFLLLPSRFWTRVDVTLAVFPSRLWCYALCFAFIAYALSTLGVVGAWGYSTHRLNTLYSTYAALNPNSPFSAQQYITDLSDPAYWAGLAWGLRYHASNNSAAAFGSSFQLLALVVGMTMPWWIIMGVIPTTRRRARVRLAHISRATSWSCLAGVVALALALVAGAESIASVLTSSGRTLAPGNPALLSITQARFGMANSYAGLLSSMLMLVMIVWVQWFWIAAIVQGWRIRSVLLPVLGVIASLIGGFTALIYIGLT